MSTHIHQTIRALEQDLEVKQGECADIERALVPLRRMAGLMEDGSTPKRRRMVVKSRQSKRLIKRTNERTNEARRRPVSRAPRSLPDGGKAAEIVALLEQASPRSPGQIAKALKCQTHVVSYHLRSLTASGAVTVTGATLNRQVHLGKKIESPSPKPNGSMKPPSAIDVVEARDRQVLGKIREAGAGGRSLRELGILTGETEASLSSALTRLRVKKQISADDNGKWVSA